MENHLPKYELIKQDMIQKINNNEWKPHQVIPSENKLCKDYGVSRVTIRKTIDELVKDHYLYKQKGKGSFVSSNDIPQGLSTIHSYTEMISLRGKTASKQLLSQQVTKPSKQMADRLNMSEEEDVFVIESLYFADDEPLCINTSILPCKLFPKLDYFDVGKNSLYTILKEFYQLNMTKASQFITAENGNDRICSLLGCSKNHPLLKLNATSFSIKEGKEIPFELYETYLKSDVIGYFAENYNR
ncbi:GntR family transcriptional regulator [Bacillus sp. 1P06AnD]|uniref:GntR family transcriptional regulator n=1 Tax=Bacillus sp. 1P06AnD TaxID=3132208 RepID=UPI0039A1239A